LVRSTNSAPGATVVLVVVDVDVEVEDVEVDEEVEVVTGVVVVVAASADEVGVSTAIDDVEPESVVFAALLLHAAIVRAISTTAAPRIGFTVGSLPRAVSIT
jgi:hypothetical protein